MEQADEILKQLRALDSSYADPDSDSEDSDVDNALEDKDSCLSSSSDEEGPAVNVPPPPKRCRTRGEKAFQATMLRESSREDRWKNIDNEPVIPQFIANSKINKPLPDEPTPMDFINLFLDDKLYNLLITQTNLYAKQHYEATPNLSHHCRASQWYDVTLSEMKKFLALYFLTGVVKKPEISQYRTI